MSFNAPPPPNSGQNPGVNVADFGGVGFWAAVKRFLGIDEATRTAGDLERAVGGWPPMPAPLPCPPQPPPAPERRAPAPAWASWRCPKCLTTAGSRWPVPSDPHLTHKVRWRKAGTKALTERLAITCYRCGYSETVPTEDFGAEPVQGVLVSLEVAAPKDPVDA